MVSNCEYHPESKIEILEAAKWYDDKVDGLGLEFLLEVKSAESKVKENPFMWPKHECDTRRYLLKKFPFAFIYLITDSKIQVLAVAHLKRKPRYWRDRLIS